ncbi:MAG: hypothetical protein HYZ89_08000 [Candidatus Omnitrophica bacterium]|nr:hypothetical protein [Candidatus Omnitrophota bacterium]
MTPRRGAGWIGTGRLTRSAVVAMGLVCLSLPGQAAEVFDSALPDPASLTLVKFLATVEELKRRAQQPDGAHLGAEQIDWILEAEGHLRARGLTLPAEQERCRLIGEAYLRQGAYDQATEFFLRANDRCQFEIALWLWRNHALRLPDQVQVAEASGQPPECGTAAHRLQTAREQFTAFRSGSVFRYERRANTHAVVFVTPDRSTWPERLAWDNQKLKIALRNGERYRFDERTSTLETLPRLGSHRVSHTRPR